jgi:hypothetical protein
VLVLRKGGISEGRRGFQVEQVEFLLFPTLFHQQRESILPAWQNRFDEMAPTWAKAGQVQLEFFGHVVSWRRLECLAAVQRLRGQHIWRDEVIAQRFDWGKDKNIYALAIRVFRLAEPVRLPVLPSYGGCKSWVDLEQEIPSEPAAPVLSKEAFNEKLNQFHAALDWDPSLQPGNGKPLS